MNVYKGVGFISSILGALILLEVENFEFEGKTLGNLMIVASSLCGAVNSLIQKSVLNTGIHPLVVQTYVCVIGTMAFSVGYAPFGLFDADDYAMSSRTWIYAIIVGVVASALPWCVGIIALKNTSPMTTSVYVVLQPPLAAFVGVVLIGEALTWRQVVGSALVLLGLVFVNANPIVQKVLDLIRRRIFVNTKQQFELLPSKAEEESEVEMKEIKEGDYVVELDGAGATVEDDGVVYDLSGNGATTNDFVIEDEPPPPPPMTKPDEAKTSVAAGDVIAPPPMTKPAEAKIAVAVGDVIAPPPPPQKPDFATNNNYNFAALTAREAGGFTKREPPPFLHVEAVSVRA